MFLLDTDVISELRKAKSGRANRNVVKWARSVSATALYLCAITILELETGVLLIERRDAANVADFGPTGVKTIDPWHGGR